MSAKPLISYIRNEVLDSEIGSFLATAENLPKQPFEFLDATHPRQSRPGLRAKLSPRDPGWPTTPSNRA